MIKKLLVLTWSAALLSAYSLAWNVEKMVAYPDMMPTEPYEITQQRYIYSGELPTDVSGFPIYKWVNAMIENDKVKSVISSLKIDQFDLSQLQNTTLTNVTLKENKENWFRVTLDFEGGYLSVYRDYNYAYYQRMQTQNQNFQRLSNEEALNLAKEFVSKYKLNISQFGDPYVEETQQPVAYDMVSSSSPAYVDPYVQIVFPTKVDGKNVNERYGQNAWLRLSISSQDKSVQGFSLKVEKLAPTNEAKLITDQARIKKIIEKGWYEYNYDYWTWYTVKYQDIELTNARVEYVKVDTYVEWVNTYYAPALVFDVVKPTDPNIYAQNKIIVPLVDKAYETY